MYGPFIFWAFAIAPFDDRRVIIQKTGITPNKNRNVFFFYQHWDKTNKNEDIELCIWVCLKIVYP